MTALAHLINWLDLAGIAVFAASGALVASRKEMDIIGFALLATFTGIGGGTARDVILDRQIFWLADQRPLLVCLGVALAVYIIAAWLNRRYRVLLWLDAAGLAAFAVLGAHIALGSGASPLVAIAMGVITATFGGLIRDVISGETPLILLPEIYATAAVAAAAAYVVAAMASGHAPLAAIIGIATGLILRGCAIRFGWTLPRYRPRPGRAY